MVWYAGQQNQLKALRGISGESPTCVPTLGVFFIEDVIMKKIPLSNNRGFTLVDDKDFEMLSKHKWHILQQKHTSYAITHIKRNGKQTTLRMHRLVMGEPQGMQVDHIDGDGLNNQRFNLRACTNKQNSMNQRSTYGSSRYKGVSWNKANSKWQAHIQKDGKLRRLGYYGSETEAAKAYDEGARKHFGEFAYLNFPKKGEQGCRK